MQIIIPLTGNGSRFVNAGYKTLKPFIKVDDLPIIEWVVKLFPNDEDKIIFICRDEHLKNLDYTKKELERIAPKSQLFAIDNWQKKGPVFDVLRASKLINDNSPCLISYCDFFMHWDYLLFKKQLLENNFDGSIPCYSGFHPHLIHPKNLYATCKVDDKNNLIEIREKFSWHKNKFLDLHSAGVYYFKSGEILKKYCQKLLDNHDHLNNEYYVSMVFNYLVKDNLKVWCPNIVERFCQWGTPEDLQEYLFWTKNVKNFKI
jgi:NDP-sugar pyrophosphorylase family protein